MSSAWSLDNPLFVSHLFYSAVLLTKMLLMSHITGFYRLSLKVFANPEDAESFSGKVKIDPDVERVRRAHLNDIENIPAFIMIGFLYLLTSPAAATAMMLMRVFTAGRILHSIFYLKGSSLRPICYAVPAVINLYMCIRVVWFLW